MRLKTKRLYKTWRRWGGRFKKAMLERSRFNRAISLLEQRPPFCYAPSMFTRGYLRRSKMLREERVAMYFEVLRREMRSKRWEPMIHDR